MNSPSRKPRRDLHERMMSDDPTATLDIFMTFMGPLIRALEHNQGCSYDDANASASDAVWTYLRNPGRYDARKANLWTFLHQIAKRRAHDTYRSTSARTRRETDRRTISEVHPSAPNTYLEDRIIAKQQLERLAQRVEAAGLPDRDVAGIRVIIVSEGRAPADEMAVALGLSHLPDDERLHAVRRHTERLRRLLRSLCMEESDVEA